MVDLAADVGKTIAGRHLGAYCCRFLLLVDVSGSGVGSGGSGGSVGTRGVCRGGCWCCVDGSRELFLSFSIFVCCCCRRCFGMRFVVSDVFGLLVV